MEARSLRSVNELAANPPQYPVNPTEERQDPLVLYISRVPGTRDVILSPFKPQEKIVSGEDVASCLYYIHLEKNAPDFQSPPPTRDDGFGSSGDEGSIKNIPRKPVPENANAPAVSSRENLFVPGEDRQGSTRTRGHADSTLEMPHHGQDGRRSLDGRGFDNRTDWTPVARQNPAGLSRSQTISRKPIGPRARPNLNRPVVERPVPLGPEFQPRKEGERVPAQGYDPRGSLPTSRSPSPRKLGEASYTNPFTLALIRREPSTGHQWNVAHVSSYQSETTVQPESEDAGPLFSPVPPVTQGQNNAANPPINIQIETLGYGKFRNMPTRRSFDAGPGDGIPEDSSFPRSEGAVLSRQVLMGYAKTWSTNFKERWNQDSLNQQREHRRHGSVASADSTGSNPEDLSPGPQTSLGFPLPGMKPRGYIFTSPWNGRCEFRTGPTGRSLRCYHVLSDEKPAFNSMMEQQGLPAPPQGGSMLLSELRFNLPTHELFKSPEGREEVKTQIQGHFNKLLQRLDNRQERSDDDDGTISPFDVNLGKEKAGGGKHGKRAKLGKLIIYPHGLKMLDMVVAANMGIWWGAWERSF